MTSPTNSVVRPACAERFYGSLTDFQQGKTNCQQGETNCQQGKTNCQQGETNCRQGKANCQAGGRDTNCSVGKQLLTREENARMEVGRLTWANYQLQQTLHNAGLGNQKDRIALNNMHAHSVGLQRALKDSTTARVKIGNQLHKERLARSFAEQAFQAEISKHQETKEQFGRVWSTVKQIGDFLTTIRLYPDDTPVNFDKIHLNISELILDNEAKTAKIKELEKSKEQRPKDLREGTVTNGGLRVGELAARSDTLPSPNADGEACIKVSRSGSREEMVVPFGGEEMHLREPLSALWGHVLSQLSGNIHSGHLDSFNCCDISCFNSIPATG